MIDAHFHIWRQRDLPWLQGVEQPRIFGAYGGIRRDYPIGEYLADIAATGIAQAVYVQANWASGRGQDEALWVQSVAEETGWPHGIVAFADLCRDDATVQLDKLATIPLVRGIRQQLHWHTNPAYRFAARPDLLREPALRANLARLAEFGWSFDLQVFSGQMADAAALARACPQTTFILQHAGMPENRSDKGRAQWRAGMQAMAGCPNMTVKLSGLGTFIHRNDPAFIRSVTDETIDLFGAERCLFGSNFPIEKLWTGYGALIAAFEAATAGRSGRERNAIFEDTARRVYRL